MALNGKIKNMERTIYVQLLDEGTVSYRPVSAVRIKENLYKIQGKEIYDPDIEEWEFLPDEQVEVEKRTFQDGEIGLVAIKRIDD